MIELKKRFLKEVDKCTLAPSPHLFEKDDYEDLNRWAIENKYVDGIEIKGEKPNILSFMYPRLTMDGREYLKSLDVPKDNTLKVEITNPEEIAPELKDIALHLSKLNYNQQEMIKILVNKIEILDEIIFLEADKVEIMKEKLKRLRSEDTNKSLPWETIITVISTLASLRP